MQKFPNLRHLSSSRIMPQILLFPSEWEILGAKQCCAMGSAFAANLFTEPLEKGALNLARDKCFHLLTTWTWQAGVFQQHWNSASLWDSIKFKVEIETKGSTTFPRCLVKRDGNKLMTSMLRKRTHTKEHTFTTFHLSTLKLRQVLILCLQHRACSLCKGSDTNARLNCSTYRGPLKQIVPALDSAQNSSQTQKTARFSYFHRRGGKTQDEDSMLHQRTQWENWASSTAVKALNIRAAFKMHTTIW